MRKIEMTNKWTQDDFQRAQSDRDRWRRAHEIVEGERDLARDRCRELERERDGAMQARNTALVLVSQAQDERDEALDRAEAAEARTAPAVSRIAIEHAIMAAGVVNAGYVDGVADNICALFGVEAEPADQVEELAERLYAEYWGGDRAHLPWSHQDEEGREGFLRIAAHVLGQEGHDE